MQQIHRVSAQQCHPAAHGGIDRHIRLQIQAGTQCLAAVDFGLPLGLPSRYASPYQANILFCFFNEQYWLYAVESYAYNLYFLFIVGYVCRAYVLKSRPGRGELGGLGSGLLVKESSADTRNREKVIFYSVFISLLVLYTGIFAASMVKELGSNDDSSGKVRYCEGNPFVIQRWNTFALTCYALS